MSLSRLSVVTPVLPRSPVAEEATDPAHALASRAADGEVEATRELLDLVSGAVRRAATAVLGPSHADIEDVVQQSLIAFVQALPRFRGECHPRSYACTISVRAAMATRHKRSRDQTRIDELAREEGVEVQHACCPSEVSAATRRRKLVRQLLDELPEVQAETLALRSMLGYSLKEVAEATGAPVNTVRSRMRLAKEALRRRIEADPTLIDELGRAK